MPRSKPPATDARLAVAYLRVSTGEQHNGLKVQRDAVERYARSQKLRIVSWHEDAGVSGGRPAGERRGFDAALMAMQAAKAGVLLIQRRDRLARDVVEAAVGTRLVERQGARIVSADGSANGDGPEQVLMRNMLDAFAQFERALIRSRTRAALGRLRSEGKRFCRRAPYGSRWTATGRMAPAPQELKTLRRMKALRARGLTLRQVADALLKEGHRPRESARWNPMVLCNLLRRQVGAA